MEKSLFHWDDFMTLLSVINVSLSCLCVEGSSELGCLFFSYSNSELFPNQQKSFFGLL